MDWADCEVVEVNPLKLHGKPIVRGTRMDADGLLENYESGLSVDDLHHQFRVDKDKIRAVLAFAASRKDIVVS